MKQLLETIVKTETELQDLKSKSDSESSVLLDQAKQKISQLEKQFEEQYQYEKETKTKEVIDGAQAYSLELKKNLEKSAEKSTKALQEKKQALKDAIIRKVIG